MFGNSEIEVNHHFVMKKMKRQWQKDFFFQSGIRHFEKEVS